MLPFADLIQEFQHDNAPPHRSSMTMEFLHQNDIKILPWRAKNADLNITRKYLGYLEVKNKRKKICFN